MMTSHSSNKACFSLDLVSNEEESFGAVASGSPSFDFRNRYSSWDWQIEELPKQEDFFSEIFPSSDPWYASLDVQERSNAIQDDAICNYENEFGIWNELGSLFANDQALTLYNNEETDDSETSKRMKHERSGEEKNIGARNTHSKALTKEMISHYFYMPIKHAAKELNVGLTLLKKRCRELGIKRWPNRKLMSLQTLIRNLQELAKVEDRGSEAKLREAIQILERERKMLEETPDMQLEHNTRKLRQACFKANYKKRKSMCLMDRPSTSVSCESEYEDEELQFLLCDSFSSNNIML